jgi:hypothetical protein
MAIASFLSICCILAGQPAANPSSTSNMASSAALEIEKKLLQPVKTIRWDDIPLEKALAELSRLSGVTIVPDKDALQRGMSLSEPVNLHVLGVAFRSVLSSILRPFSLRYVVKDDVIVVTDEGPWCAMWHSVDDLVSSPDCFWRATAVFAIDSERQIQRARPVKEMTKEELLIELIVYLIAPDTWACAGGGGTIRYDPVTRYLVVIQRSNVQEQVVELLNAVRELRTHSAPCPVTHSRTLPHVEISSQTNN